MVTKSPYHPLTISKIGLTSLARFELRDCDVRNAQENHLRFTAYNDGNETIGFGTIWEKGDLKTPLISNVISYKKGLNWLMRELMHYEMLINDFCRKKHLHLKQHEFDILVARAFNANYYKYTLPLLKLMKKDKADSSAFKNLLSEPSNGSDPGLLYRRDLEAAYFRTGDPSALRFDETAHSISGRNTKLVLAKAGAFKGRQHAIHHVIAKAGQAAPFLTQIKGQPGRLAQLVDVQLAQRITEKPVLQQNQRLTIR